MQPLDYVVLTFVAFHAIFEIAGNLAGWAFRTVGGSADPRLRVIFGVGAFSWVGFPLLLEIAGYDWSHALVFSRLWPIAAMVGDTVFTHVVGLVLRRRWPPGSEWCIPYLALAGVMSPSVVPAAFAADPELAVVTVIAAVFPFVFFWPTCYLLARKDS